MKSFLNKTALAAFRLLPTRVARHLLFLLQSSPRVADKWGYHIRANHYYDPLPDFAAITPETLRARRIPAAIDFRLTEQLHLLSELARFASELDALASSGGFNFENEYFSGLDAAIYYALIRRLKPGKVVEIGSGYSTQIAHHAMRRNAEEGSRGTLTCIEPYPAPRLTEARLEIELIQKRVEEVGMEVFQGLGSGDILFIDSSHVVKFRSDVHREFLDILPALAPGVWIHVHDIFFPRDYPAKWLVEKRIAFNEQYFLEAFLAFNSAFEVRLANYWLCVEHAPEVARFWPRLGSSLKASESPAASFWMQRTK